MDRKHIRAKEKDLSKGGYQALDRHDHQGSIGKGSSKFSQTSSSFIRWICWAWLLSGIVQTLPSSFFPSEAASSGVPDLWIGMIFSAYQSMMILSTPFTVAWTPHVGPLPLVRGSLAFLVIANGMMGLTAYLRHDVTKFVIATISLRGISGLSSCGIMIGGNTCVMQSSNVEDLGFNLAIFETAGSVGLCIGPILGSYLFSLSGYKTTFLGLSVLMLTGLLMPRTSESTHAIGKDKQTDSPVDKEQAMAQVTADARHVISDASPECCDEPLQPPPDHHEVLKREQEQANTVNFKRFLRSPYLCLLCLDLMAAGVAWTFIDPVLERHLHDANNFDQLITGGCFGLMSFSYILATALVGIISKRFHGDSCWNFGVMYLGMGMLATALLFLTSTDVAYELMGLSLLGVGQAFTYLPIVLALTFKLKGLTSGDVSVTVAGISQFFVSIGFALGPFVGSELTSKISFPTCCAIFAACISCCLGLTAIALGTEFWCSSTPQAAICPENKPFSKE